MKKYLIGTSLIFGAFLVVNPVLAGSDDFKWVNQCIEDNKSEGQEDSVVIAYCSCMNNKMSATETQSISEWEKTHPKEAEECAAQAGWQE